MNLNIRVKIQCNTEFYKQVFPEFFYQPVNDSSRKNVDRGARASARMRIYWQKVKVGLSAMPLAEPWGSERLPSAIHVRDTVIYRKRSVVC